MLATQTLLGTGAIPQRKKTLLFPSVLQSRRGVIGQCYLQATCFYNARIKSRMDATLSLKNPNTSLFKCIVTSSFYQAYKTKDYFKHGSKQQRDLIKQATSAKTPSPNPDSPGAQSRLLTVYKMKLSSKKRGKN